jgi:two-component system, LytTR family, sensor kinase
MLKYFTSFLKYAFLISLAIYLVDQGAGWINGNPVNSFVDEFKKFTVYFLYSFIIGGANVYLVVFLDKRLSWKTDAQKRLIVGVVGSVIVSLIAVAVSRLLVALIDGHNLTYFIEHQKIIHYFYSLVISLIVLIFFHAFYFYKALTEKKVSETEFVAKTESAKYESLKSQLDPHFLFNSLNVLTALIGEDPDKAEHFTTKLSKVYRYVLEQKDKDLIAIQEELNFAKTYMELLKMRFEEAVQFELPKKISNPDFKIIPLSLQILLENAVKHNVISKENPLTIIIYEEDNTLCVVNKINLKSVLKKSTQVGLKNIKERYALITKRAVEVLKSDTEFKVKLPLLTKKIKTMSTNFLKEDRYMHALKQVKDIKDFYSGLLAYCLVIPGLFLIWYKFTPHVIQWFWFPAVGWGIGLFFHAMKAFNYSPFLGRNWEERKLKEFMENDSKEQWL